MSGRILAYLLQSRWTAVRTARRLGELLCVATGAPDSHMDWWGDLVLCSAPAALPYSVAEG